MPPDHIFRKLSLIFQSSGHPELKSTVTNLEQTKRLLLGLARIGILGTCPTLLCPKYSCETHLHRARPLGGTYLLMLRRSLQNKHTHSPARPKVNPRGLGQAGRLQQTHQLIKTASVTAAPLWTSQTEKYTECVPTLG